MVSCHMLSELEEVIQYKLVPERREIIRQIWWERLQVRLWGACSRHPLALALVRKGFLQTIQWFALQSEFS